MSPYVIDLDSGAMSKLLMQVFVAAIPTTNPEERYLGYCEGQKASSA
jgi:hypothetical protein